MYKSIFEQELENRKWAKMAIQQVISEFNDGKRSHTSAINTLYKIAYDFHKPSLIKAREELRKKKLQLGDLPTEVVRWSDIILIFGK